MRFTKEDERRLASMERRAKEGREPDYSVRIRQLLQRYGVSHTDGCRALRLAYGEHVPFETFKHWCSSPLSVRWRPAPRWAWLYLRWKLEGR